MSRIHKTAFVVSTVLTATLLVLFFAAHWAGPAAADDAEHSRRVTSMSYDWDASNTTVTLFTVPEGQRLVVTDVCSFWWGNGAAQRLYVYQDAELKASFLASGRGHDGSSNFNAFPSCFSSSQSGLLFESGTQVRIVPSTTFLSVTMTGYLER